MKHTLLVLALAASTTVFAAEPVMVFNHTQTSINIEYDICKYNHGDCSRGGAHNMWQNDGMKPFYVYLETDEYLNIHTVNEIDFDGTVISDGVSGPLNRCTARANQKLSLHLDRTTGVLCSTWG